MTPGFVRLRSTNPPLNVYARLGPDAPKLTGGFGGWEVTQRPRDVGMTVWQGVPPFEYTLNLLLGNESLRDAPSLERVLSQLITVARGDDNHPPGVVTITGMPGLPADRWIINNLDFGDIVRNRQMETIRQTVTITFLEYQPPEYGRLARGALAKPKQRTVIYTVKRGDTPAKIARARRCKWTDIRAINRKGLITKANQTLKAGSRINVPVKVTPPKKKKKTR
jgi:hypothetical protein